MTHSTHKEELHAGTARGLHHLTGRLRGRGGLARVVGTRRTRVSRLARPAAGTRLHDLDGSEHVPSDVRIRHRIYDGYPDVTLEMVASRTFDGRLQLLEYVPTVLTGPLRSHPAS